MLHVAVPPESVQPITNIFLKSQSKKKYSTRKILIPVR
uniref:V-type proton ATPase subunit a1-like n=1 Tax=Rhizophora mucronata TaxID=61149 RepID=A0A2P2LRV7_RHIMU